MTIVTVTSTATFRAPLDTGTVRNRFVYLFGIYPWHKHVLILSAELLGTVAGAVPCVEARRRRHP